MNKYIALLLLALCGAGCNCSRDNLPPSNYAGIISGMGQYVNGELPGTDRNFTGDWQEYYANGNIRMAGAYRNGIPVGCWKRYYINGTTECSWTYYSNGEAETIDYFPDGMPRTRDRYRYRFGDNKYTLEKIQPTKYWDFLGNVEDSKVIPCFFWKTIPGPIECGYAFRMDIQQEYDLAPFVDAQGNHFQMKIFLIPKASRKEGETLQSFFVQGQWNPETQSAENITIQSCGDFSLKFKQTRPDQEHGNTLWFDFEISERQTPADLLSVALLMKGPQ